MQPSEGLLKGVFLPRAQVSSVNEWLSSSSLAQEEKKAGTSSSFSVLLQERGSLFLCQIKAYCGCEELEVGLYTLVQANCPKGCDNHTCWYSNL